MDALLAEALQTGRLNLSYLGTPAAVADAVTQALSTPGLCVTELDLSSNGLEELPPLVGAFSALRRLQAKYNKLSRLPAELLGGLPRLEALDLEGNHIEAVEEGALPALPALRRLNMAANGLAALPDCVGRCRVLEALTLSNNPLTQLPEALAGCPVTHLDVSSCRLLSLPPALATCRTLQRLFCQNNDLPRVPTALGHLPNLKEWNLRANRLPLKWEQARERGLAKFLAFLREEEEIEVLQEIERNRPVGIASGPCMIFRCKAVMDDVAAAARAAEPTDGFAWIRSGYVTVQHRNQLMVLGGVVIKDGRKTAELLVLNTDTMGWRVQPTRGDKPCPRDGHVAVVDPSGGAAGHGQLILFGGRNASGRRLNDLHVLDLATWTWYVPKQEGAALPAPREQAAAAFSSDGRLLLFGGRTNGARLNDLWSWDVESGLWEQLPSHGAAPSPRQGAAACLSGAQLFIMGGSSNFVLHDCCVYNVETQEWHTLSIEGPSKAAARAGGHIVTWQQEPAQEGEDGGGALWMFGGRDALGAQVSYLLKLKPRQGGAWYEWVETEFSMLPNRSRITLFDSSGRLNIAQCGHPLHKLNVTADAIEKGNCIWDVVQMVPLSSVKEKEVRPEDQVNVNPKRERIKHATLIAGKLPPAFSTHTARERQLLAAGAAFQRRWAAMQGSQHRLPPCVTLLNECGVEKGVCTTLRWAALPHVELHDLDSIAQFVSEFFACEPLEDPQQAPTHLVSPWSLLEWQAGDSFDLATLACSLLLGAGYNAFVVVGYADKQVALGDQSRTQCPWLSDLGLEAPPYTELLEAEPSLEGEGEEEGEEGEAGSHGQPEEAAQAAAGVEGGDAGAEAGAPHHGAASGSTAMSAEAAGGGDSGGEAAALEERAPEQRPARAAGSASPRPGTASTPAASSRPETGAAAGSSRPATSKGGASPSRPATGAAAASRPGTSKAAGRSSRPESAKSGTAASRPATTKTAAAITGARPATGAAAPAAASRPAAAKSAGKAASRPASSKSDAAKAGKAGTKGKGPKGKRSKGRQVDTDPAEGDAGAADATDAEAAAAEEEAQLPAIEEHEEEHAAVASPPPAPRHRRKRYVHAFVLVKPGRREVVHPLLLDPATGRLYSMDDAPCCGVEFCWNDRNLWVSLQADSSGSSDCGGGGSGLAQLGVLNWSFSNPNCWLPLLLSREDFQAEAGTITTQLSLHSSKASDLLLRSHPDSRCTPTMPRHLSSLSSTKGMSPRLHTLPGSASGLGASSGMVAADGSCAGTPPPGTAGAAALGRASSLAPGGVALGHLAMGAPRLSVYAPTREMQDSSLAFLSPEETMHRSSALLPTMSTAALLPAPALIAALPPAVAAFSPAASPTPGAAGWAANLGGAGGSMGTPVAASSLLEPPPEMPLSWVPQLSISRERLDMRCPRGQKVVVYRQARRELYARYGECGRWDGLVERVTTYDGPTGSPLCVLELFNRRRDRLARRLAHPMQRATLSSYEPGAPSCVKSVRVVRGMGAQRQTDISFYAESRADGLIRRQRTSSTLEEWFLPASRPDGLVHRVVTYADGLGAALAREQAAALQVLTGRVGSASSAKASKPGVSAAVAAAKPGAAAGVGKPGSGAGHNRRRSSLVVGWDAQEQAVGSILEEYSRRQQGAVPAGRQGTDAAPAPATAPPAVVARFFDLTTGQQQVVEVEAGDAGEGAQERKVLRAYDINGRLLTDSEAAEAASAVGAVGAGQAPSQEEQLRERAALAQACRGAQAAVLGSEEESRDILQSTQRQEQGDALVTAHYDAMRVKVEDSDSGEAVVEEESDSYDFLAHFLPHTGARDLTAGEAEEAVAACLAAFDDRQADRQRLLSTRMAECGAELARLRGIELHHLSPADQDRVRSEQAAATFRMRVVQRRAEEHAPRAAARRAELEARLAADRRLAVALAGGA